MARRRKKPADRCTGHCCTALTVPFSPEQLRAAYERWNKGGHEPIRMAGIAPADTKLYQDIHLIAPMLTHLGFFKKAPVRQVNPNDDDVLGKSSDGAHYYACKHFDRKQKVCTIYEIRPAMCREYPYGKPCNYAGCTWSSHKAKRETRTERTKRLRILREQSTAKKDPGGDKQEVKDGG